MQPADFIDIHCHLLPGVDDGPKTLEQSLALAARYAGAGIRQVFATPHFLPGTIWSAGPEQIHSGLDRLRRALREHGLKLEIFPGMEIAIQAKMEKRLDKGCYLPLGNSGCYLLEPPLEGRRFNPLDPVKAFTRRGKKVILAHPERSEFFQRHPEILRRARSRDLALQVNIGSLLGHFGPGPRQTALQLLAWEAFDYLASDAHSHQGRRPPNADDWRRLRELVPPEILRETAAENPARLAAAARPDPR